eukprot:TRINITY_DN11512_c0_g1_i1.p1 TRINITY_DN11512_c0_g1~~TRINITY_DN11512_c0_g1_i1.p1  ORF type:complete len:557 (+),score=105.87 TRINITY_DN11512_c0_g1_i1:75-1745(+)
MDEELEKQANVFVNIEALEEKSIMTTMDDGTERLYPKAKEGTFEELVREMKEKAQREIRLIPTATPVDSTEEKKKIPASRVWAAIRGNVELAQKEIDQLLTVLAALQTPANELNERNQSVYMEVLKLPKPDDQKEPEKNLAYSIYSKRNHLQASSQRLQETAERFEKILKKEDHFTQDLLHLRKKWKLFVTPSKTIGVDYHYGNKMQAAGSKRELKKSSITGRSYISIPLPALNSRLSVFRSHDVADKDSGTFISSHHRSRFTIPLNTRNVDQTLLHAQQAVICRDLFRIFARQIPKLADKSLEVSEDYVSVPYDVDKGSSLNLMIQNVACPVIINDKKMCGTGIEYQDSVAVEQAMEYVLYEYYYRYCRGLIKRNHDSMDVKRFTEIWRHRQLREVLRRRIVELCRSIPFLAYHCLLTTDPRVCYFRVFFANVTGISVLVKKYRLVYESAQILHSVDELMERIVIECCDRIVSDLETHAQILGLDIKRKCWTLHICDTATARKKEITLSTHQTNINIEIGSAAGDAAISNKKKLLLSELVGALSYSDFLYYTCST